MGDKSHIEWTDATWNPVRGCSLVSSGCTNCYAMKVAGGRAKKHYEGLTRPTAHGPVWTGEVRLVPELLDLPLRWKKPRRIFVNSMSDLFHESVPDEFIRAVFGMMAWCTHKHTFQILTKRPERMLRWLINEQNRPERYKDWFEGACAHIGGNVPVGSSTSQFPLPNVWLGVSVEDQKTADERIPILLQTPAAVRWISAEPLLGPVDIGSWRRGTCTQCHGFDDYCADVALCDTCKGLSRIGLDWVVAGGESGHGARPMHPDWARSLRDQCAAAGVPFLFKQWGSWAPHEYCNLEGTKSFVKVSLKDDDPRERVMADSQGRAFNMKRVGKKAAGRLLDGREWNEYPALRYGSEALPTQGERKEEAGL